MDYKLKTTHMVFWDVDGVIWHPQIKGDYIGSVKSPLKLIEKQKTLLREKDGMVFIFDDGLVEGLKFLKENGIISGIVSDNPGKPVIWGLSLFGIQSFFDANFSYVKLFKGYCPKVRLILEILEKNRIDSKNSKILFIDNKDYAKEAQSAGIGFYQYTKQKPLLEILKEWNA